MKTITIASAKGGSAKTTTAVTLACRAAQDFGNVTMLDLNADQGSLTAWWTLRGRSVNPYLLQDIKDLKIDLQVLDLAGQEIAVIDTPPMELDLIELAVSVADAVIIPVMASYFDTSAVDCVVEMCRRLSKPYAFLLSAWDGRKIFAEVNDEATAGLAGRGPVLNARLSYHPKYRVGQSSGKTGPESDASLKAEVDAVWLEVAKLAGIAPRVVPISPAVKGRVARGKR